VDEIILQNERGEWYDLLIDDCKAIITEAVFTSRWALVEGYHNLGERVATDGDYIKWEQSKAGAVLSRVSKDLNISERTLYRAIQFYECYPDLSTVPEGKNISWHKIVNKYLPEKIDEIEQTKNTDIQSTWNVERGQIWKLGSHKLMCGDAYSLEDERRLFRDNRVRAVITDPPYGIGYKPDWNKWNGSPTTFNQIVGDDQDFDPTPFLSYPTVALFGANYFSNRLPIGGWICWDKRLDANKDAMMFGSPFELAWFRSINTTKRAIMIRLLHGGVINADSEVGNNEMRQHPTQKPTGVMMKIIEALTMPNDVIYDPFAGSGTTIMAADKIERTCLAMEIESKYVASALQRWFDKKGTAPCLE
jgi:DNA modification methylase